MKKKNLFVGLLLASAVFSLAACTDKKPAKTDDKTTDVTPSTQSTPVTPTSDKPSTPTSDKPTTPTSDKPTTPTSSTPVETTTDERELISFSIDSENVKKEYTVGDKIDLTGLVVKANYDNGDIETVTDYELKVLNGDTEVALDAELTAGTYTISVKVGDKKAKTFEVICKVEQYKYTLPIIVDDYVDYLDSMDINVESSYTIPKDTKLIENESFSIDATTDGVIIQKTDSNNNPVAKEYDGVTYDTRIQVNGSSKVVVFTAKADGKLDILYQTSSGRYIAVKDDSSPAIITAGEAVTDETKDAIHKMTVDIVAGKKYTIYSSEKGSNVYAMYFNGSVDASTRIATNEFYFWPTVTEFDIVDNKFDPTDIDAIIEAKDNYGVVRDVDFTDCTVTVKDSGNQTVEGEITVAGTYTVTVEYDGKEVTFDISVSDPNAVISEISVDTTNAKKTYYEGDTLDVENITVKGTKGAVEVTLTDEEYTTKLLKGSDEVTEFTTSGAYTVLIILNENTEITVNYTVQFNTVDLIEIAGPAENAMDVAIGSTEFYIGDITATGTYTDEKTVDLSSELTYELYADADLNNKFSTDTEAFAAEGTVYAKVSCRNTNIVITITVKEIKVYEWASTDIDPTGKNDKDALAAGPLNSYFTLVGNKATVRLNSDKTKVTSIELNKSFSSYIEFTTTGPATIVLGVASTGGTSTTTGFGVYTDTAGTTLATAKEGAAANVAGEASGTAKKELTFTVSEAGTYYIGYTESERNGRIISITVTLD